MVLALAWNLGFVSNVYAEEDLLSALDTSNLPVAELIDDPEMKIEEESTATSLLSADPDFQIRDFYRRRKPVNELKVPEPEDGERLMWKLGETIRDVEIPHGEYFFIRAASRESGYYIRYLGKGVSDGSHLKITEAGNEIVPGDLVVKERYEAVNIPPITGDGGAVPLDSKALGRVSAFLEPGHDERTFFAGNRQLIGAKFKEYKGGNSVSIGATFVIRRKGEEIAKAVVVDADLDLATLYVYQSVREVKYEDEVFIQ